jgi:hypothetical protein
MKSGEYKYFHGQFSEGDGPADLFLRCREGYGPA